MKKYLKKAGLCITLAAIAFSIFSFEAETPYTVTGKIAGLPEGTVLQLIPAATHKEEKPVASATIKNGTFIFQGDLSSPRLYFVKIASSDFDAFQLMIEDGNIEVTGTASQETTNGQKRWIFKDVQVKGSEAHDAYLQKTSLRSRLNILYENNNNSNKKIFDQLNAARAKKDTVLEKKLHASDAYKKMAADEAKFFKTAEDSISTLILSNKDSWWGPFLMVNEMSYFRPEDKAVFEKFSKEAKESHYGQLVAAELYPVSLVGKPAPSLSFADNNGKKVSFSSQPVNNLLVLLEKRLDIILFRSGFFPQIQFFYKVS